MPIRSLEIIHFCLETFIQALKSKDTLVTNQMYSTIHTFLRLVGLRDIRDIKSYPLYPFVVCSAGAADSASSFDLLRRRETFNGHLGQDNGLLFAPWSGCPGSAILGSE